VRTARLASRFDPALARVTWIGHSTVLLEMDGVRLLTDPVLRPRVIHLRRVAPPAGEIGPVDAILISHGHYDHLDSKSLARFDRATLVIAPRRVRGFTNVVEVAVGDEVAVGSVNVAATAAAHVRNSVGFLLTGSERIYFAGDTDLFDGMRELAPVDVALLPIAGWGPRLPPGHLDPARAAQALELLRPRVVVPIHWGTYTRIGLKRDEQEPARRFAGLAADFDVRVLPVGGSLDVPVAAAVR
jgi:L-ascorbate metabolism protein UlaG (beta-lactamase superfamily)